MTERRQNTDNHQNITLVRYTSNRQCTVSDITQISTGQAHKLLHAAFCTFKELVNKINFSITLKLYTKM